MISIYVKEYSIKLYVRENVKVRAWFLDITGWFVFGPARPTESGKLTICPKMIKTMNIWWYQRCFLVTFSNYHKRNKPSTTFLSVILLARCFWLKQYLLPPWIENIGKTTLTRIFAHGGAFTAILPARMTNFTTPTRTHGIFSWVVFRCFHGIRIIWNNPPARSTLMTYRKWVGTLVDSGDGRNWPYRWNIRSLSNHQKQETLMFQWKNRPSLSGGIRPQ